MIWLDLLLRDECDTDALQGALAEAFGVPWEQVAVVDSIESIPHNMTIAAVTGRAIGDFATLMSIYVLESARRSSPIAVGRRLSAALRTCALLPDASENPYAMLMIDETGVVTSVALDVQSVDERQEYRLDVRYTRRVNDEGSAG